MSIAEMEARELELDPTGGGLWHDAFQRLRRSPAAIVGAVMIAILLFLAIFAPLIAPYSPTEQNLDAIAAGCCPGPSREHLLGVDDLGRDELSRLIYGARYSLLIGVVAVTIGLSMGLLLGAVAGYFRRADNPIMRLMDIMLAIPGFLMAIGIVALFGQGGLLQVMIAIGVVNIPIFTRLMRGSIIAQRDNDYVLAARSVGVPNRKILGSHIVPNAISPVIVAATLALATAIIDAAGLGFLGLGPQDPATPEWGTMLTNTVRYLQTAPFLAIFPGIAIVIAVMGFNLIGDALRETLDPKLRGRTCATRPFFPSRTCGCASGRAGGSCTRSTGSPSTSGQVRRLASWASRDAARASPRSPRWGSCRAPPASRPAASSWTVASSLGCPRRPGAGSGGRRSR